MGKWIHQSHVGETVGWFIRHAMPDAEPGWDAYSRIWRPPFHRLRATIPRNADRYSIRHRPHGKPLPPVSKWPIPGIEACQGLTVH